MFHFGKGNDLEAVLLCPPHIIENRVGFTALGDGDQEGRFNIALHGIAHDIAEKHIIVKVHPVEYGKSADRHPVGDVVRGDIRKTGTDHETVAAAELTQTGTEVIHLFAVIVVDERLQIKGALGSGIVMLADQLENHVLIAGETKPFAHFADKGSGNEILIGNLGNVDLSVTAFNVMDDACDNAGLYLI